MKQFLVTIGWMKPSGKWDTSEIFVDVIVLSGIVFVAVLSYTVWAMYNA